MSALRFEEMGSGVAKEKPHLASGAKPSTINRKRQVRCGPWRDLARDWHLWSSAERAVAVFLLFALTTMPAVSQIAWLCWR